MFYFFELPEYLFLLGQQSYSSLPCVIVTSVQILIVMYHSKKKKKGTDFDVWHLVLGAVSKTQ